MTPKRLRACGLPRGPTRELGSSAAYRSPRKFLEADGRVEGVAQDRLAGVDIAKLGGNA
jgi:hypothetical protein